MVVIEFTRVEEHFGSAESQMMSMYSQFISTACGTTGNPGQLSIYCERIENGVAH